MDLPEHWKTDESEEPPKTVPMEGLVSSPCSLDDCPAGEMLAKLPYYREKPIRVVVDVWLQHRGGIPREERTVKFLTGCKTDFLSDAELEGAEFYPENASSDTRR